MCKVSNGGVSKKSLTENISSIDKSAPAADTGSNLQLGPHPSNAKLFCHVQLIQVTQALVSQFDDVRAHEELDQSLMNVPGKRLCELSNGKHCMQMKRLTKDGKTLEAIALVIYRSWLTDKILT